MSIVNNRVDILFVSCSEKYLLKKSIKSIFNQSFKNWRLLLVDDASFDKEVYKYLRSLEKNYKNIRVFRNKKPLGLTESLINLYPFIESEFIARLDSGDEWDFDKLKLQVDYLNSTKEVGLVGTQVRFSIESGKIVRYSSYPTSFNTIREKCCNNIGLFSHSSILFRFNSDIFYKNLYYYSQDLDLYLQFISNNIVITNMEETLCTVLFTSNSISIKKKPLQLKCISRAIKNYKLRIKNELEDNKKLSTNLYDKLMWKIAEKTYINYVILSSTKKLYARFLLLISLFIYPPLISLYLPRIKYKIKNYLNIK